MTRENHPRKMTRGGVEEYYCRGVFPWRHRYSRRGIYSSKAERNTPPQTKRKQEARRWKLEIYTSLFLFLCLLGQPIFSHQNMFLLAYHCSGLLFYAFSTIRRRCRRAFVFNIITPIIIIHHIMTIHIISISISISN